MIERCQGCMCLLDKVLEKLNLGDSKSLEDMDGLLSHQELQIWQVKYSNSLLNIAQ